MVKTLSAAALLLSSSLALSATQVTRVSASGGSVQISASAPPNFTTFTMNNPPRLVVDLAETTFQGVPTDIAVNQSDVLAIKTLNYGSGPNAVARVMITYGKEIETDIVAQGNDIIVRPVGAPAVAAAPIPADVPTPSAPVAVAEARQAPAPAANPPRADQPTAMARNDAPPPATEPAPIPSSPSAATEPAPIPSSPSAAAEPAPIPSSPSAAAEPAPIPSSDSLAPEPAAAPAHLPFEPIAQADAPAPSPAPPTRPPPHLNTEANLASPPPPLASGEPAQVSARRKKLSLVGLRFTGGASVFIRTNEAVAYRVNERGDAVVVTIENTRITRRNDSRMLDAQFFDSPIASVRARQVRRNVEVEIQLKSHAAYQATQNGPEVSLSFNKS